MAAISRAAGFDAVGIACVRTHVPAARHPAYGSSLAVMAASPALQSLEHPLLPLRIFDTAASYVEILGFYLDTDEFTAQIHAGDAGGAAAREGVEDIIMLFNQFILPSTDQA